MTPSERTEEMIHAATCQTSEAMRRRMWKNVADKRQQALTASHIGSASRLWRTLMKSRIAQVAVATIVLAAALAIGVETLRPKRLNRAYAFRARIQANTALDLDPKAAIPLSQAQPEDFDVTWDSIDGGTLRIVANASLRLLACRYINPDWDDVVSWAYEHLEELQNSTTTALTPAEETPFAAVLTNEGNLAVIRVAGSDENGAWLSWRVERAVTPGYSPVRVLTLQTVDAENRTGRQCAVDLDTAEVRSIPADVLSLPAVDMLTWLEANGIDAVATASDEGLGLRAVGLVCEPWTPGSWASTEAVNLRETMAGKSFEPRLPMTYQEGQYQTVYPFKTREGTIGMLQILAADESTGTVQLRYRVVQIDDGSQMAAEAETDPQSQRLAESMQRLRRFGLMAWKYAEEHNWQYPDTIAELEGYAAAFEQDFQWILDNVGYVGAGRTADDPGTTLIAYDKTLLAIGKGTHAVFRDGHGEFIEPDRLAEYGLTDKRPSVSR